MAGILEDKPNKAERNFYERLMRKAKTNLQKAYMKHFNVSESTFYYRLKNRELSPAEKRFFREYVEKEGFDIEDFKKEGIPYDKDGIKV